MAQQSSAKVAKLLRQHPVINPRTGQVWRLSDEEIAPLVDAERRRICRSPATAKAWLVQQGFLTPSGKLARKYGG